MYTLVILVLWSPVVVACMLELAVALGLRNAALEAQAREAPFGII